ncbi:hypothetical protein HDE_01627 [Halotydeus destructor]|nr:hypothetical protein HDE_01627 [Halotydeus destructor]
MLALSYLFAGAAGHVLMLRKMSSQELIDFILDDGVFYMINAISILVLIFVIEHYKKKTRNNATIAKLHLSSRDASESHYKFALIHELEQMSHFEYTVWSLAKLNKEFILGFSSSLLTFTVMLVQLAG